MFPNHHQHPRTSPQLSCHLHCQPPPQNHIWFVDSGWPVKGFFFGFLHSQWMCPLSPQCQQSGPFLLGQGFWQAEWDRVTSIASLWSLLFPLMVQAWQPVSHLHWFQLYLSEMTLISRLRSIVLVSEKKWVVVSWFNAKLERWNGSDSIPLIDLYSCLC